MSDNDIRDETALDGGVKTPAPKPAFVLAAEHAARVEAENEAEATREKAGFALGRDPEDNKDAGVNITGKPADPSADPLNGPKSPFDPLAATRSDDASIDLRGKGWIRCADGSHIRDDGRSIFIPGRKFTPAQIAMVVELASQKGWTTLYAYNRSGTKLHPEVTQKLSAAIAQRGYAMECCADQKAAGKMSSHLKESEECFRQTLLRARQAAQRPAPAP